VYLSPWDRNNEFYGTPAYLTNVFYEQLRELNTQYGPVFENWFDGANGGDGYYGGKRDNRQIDRITYYNLNELWNIVRTTQPNSCILTDLGPDIRWVGNESGLAGETCWPTYTPKGRENIDMPGLGLTRYVEAQFGHRGGKNWMPAECDVSIRPGWFYHPEEDTKVKSVDQLEKIYFESVGRNTNLLLNIPIDRNGLVNAADSAALMQLRKRLDATFVDSKIPLNKKWKMEANSITIELKANKTFDVLSLKENISQGQMIDGWKVEAWVNDKWVFLGEATTIGYQRWLILPKTTSSKIRIRFENTLPTNQLLDVNLYLRASPNPLLDKK
jgi:alpha-L-fucosidase